MWFHPTTKNYEEEMWGGNSESLFYFQWGFFITVLDGSDHLSFFFALFLGGANIFFYFFSSETNQTRLNIKYSFVFITAPLGFFVSR